MSDNNPNGDLSGQDVKLVHYQIVSTERDRERILENRYELVTDDLSDEAFATWVVAHYFQGPHRPLEEKRKKYLRVCHHVLCRWPREALWFESRQLDELEQIARAIRERNSGEAGGDGPDYGAARPAGSGTAPAAPGRPAAAGAEQRVVEALAERDGRATVGQLNADLEGMEWADVRKTLLALAEAGRVEQTGHGATARYALRKGDGR